MSENVTPVSKPSLASRAFNAPLSKADHQFLRICLWLIAAGALAVVIVQLWPADLITFARSAADNGPASTPAGVASNVTAFWAPEKVWTIADPTYGQQLLVALPPIVSALFVMLGALILLDLVAALRTDQAFTVRSVKRVRQLGILLMAAGVLLPFIKAGTEMSLSSVVGDDAPGMLFTFDLAELTPLLVGMLLIGLAEVFGKGVRLSEDVDGLV